MTSPPGAQRAGRSRSLDGLRGVAALVVLAHHSAQVTSAGSHLTSATGDPARWSLGWWLTFSPLHLVWAGEEAVLVFFVLSGFVLALPATRRPTRWASYYASRLLRLYLPVWAALVVAVLLALAVPRDPTGSTSAFLRGSAGASSSEALHDAVLLLGTGALDPPLWSLAWEVAFSLLLPAYLWLARTRRLPVVAKVAGLGALVGAGTLTSTGALRYLPLFAFGVLLAFRRRDLVRAARRLRTTRCMSTTRARSTAWGVLAAATVLSLTARWSVGALPLSGAVGALAGAAASGLVVIGAVAAVVLAQHWAAARAGLERPVAQWLGTRSFSLYLTHHPILVTTGYALHGAVPVAVAAVVGALLALPAAEVFFRGVERPSHALARRAGRVLAPRVDSADQHGAVRAPPGRPDRAA